MKHSLKRCTLPTVVFVFVPVIEAWRIALVVLLYLHLRTNSLLDILSRVGDQLYEAEYEYSPKNIVPVPCLADSQDPWW